MPSLREFLEEKELFFDPRVLSILEAKLKKGRKAFLLRGPAGVGKTSLATAVAEYLGARLVFFQCTQGTSEDELLYKYVPSEETKSGIKITLGPLPLALQYSREGRVVLLIDEFDKTRPSADALLLDFLQNFRLALYLEDKKTVVHGDPENLVVFLTSNDVREFSEPLLRRLVVLHLKPLPTVRVLELMRKRFPENVALLLAQVYDDTVKAGLRKPATIQELCELGEVLKDSPDVPLSELLDAFILKYDDDREKFYYYVQRREPYKFAEGGGGGSAAVEERYEPAEDLEVKVGSAEEVGEAKTAELLEKLSRLRVREPEAKAVQPEEVREEAEVMMKVEEREFDGYTKVVKALRPEPTDRPDVFGKFRVVLDEGREFVVAEEPLTLYEVERLVDRKTEGEFYFEDELPLDPEKHDLFGAVIKNASKIKYYTKKRLLAEGEKEGSVVKLDVEEVERDGFIAVYRVRGYLKYAPRGVPEALREIWEIERKYYDVKSRFASVLKKALLSSVEEHADELPRKRFRELARDAYMVYSTTTYATPEMVERIVENARKIKRLYGIPVLFTTRKKNDNVYFYLGEGGELVVGIGYMYAETVGAEKKMEMDIDDPRVDEILRKLRERAGGGS